MQYTCTVLQYVIANPSPTHLRQRIRPQDLARIASMHMGYFSERSTHVPRSFLASYSVRSVSDSGTCPSQRGAIRRILEPHAFQKAHSQSVVCYSHRPAGPLSLRACFVVFCDSVLRPYMFRVDNYTSGYEGFYDAFHLLDLQHGYVMPSLLPPLGSSPSL